MVRRRGHTAGASAVPLTTHTLWEWPIQVARGGYRPGRFPGSELGPLGVTHPSGGLNSGGEGTCRPLPEKPQAVRGSSPIGGVGRRGAPDPQNPDIGLTAMYCTRWDSLIGPATGWQIHGYLQQSRRGCNGQPGPASTRAVYLLSNRALRRTAGYGSLANRSAPLSSMIRRWSVFRVVLSFARTVPTARLFFAAAVQR